MHTGLPAVHSPSGAHHHGCHPVVQLVLLATSAEGQRAPHSLVQVHLQAEEGKGGWVGG